MFFVAQRALPVGVGRSWHQLGGLVVFIPCILAAWRILQEIVLVEIAVGGRSFPGLKNVGSELLNIELLRSSTHREDEGLTGRNGDRGKLEVNLTAILAIKGVPASAVVNLPGEIRFPIKLHRLFTIQEKLKKHWLVETHLNIIWIPETDPRVETETKGVLLLGPGSDGVGCKVVINTGLNNHRSHLDGGEIPGISRTKVLLVINVGTTIA